MSIGFYVNNETGEEFELISIGSDFSTGQHTCIFSGEDGFNFTLPALEFFDGRFSRKKITVKLTVDLIHPKRGKIKGQKIDTKHMIDDLDFP